MSDKSIGLDKYSWNLEQILGDKSIEQLIDQTIELQAKLLALFKENPFNEIGRFREFHKVSLDLSVLEGKVRTYLDNKSRTDMSDTRWFAMLNSFQNRSMPFHMGLSNISEEIYRYEDQINEFLKESDLQKYHRYYRQIFKFKKHDLKLDIKQYALKFMPLSDSYQQIFSLIYDKELKIEDAVDSKGKKHPIHNAATYAKYIVNKDSDLRRTAYINYTKAIYGYRETFARLLHYCFSEFNIEAKTHNFEGGYYHQCAYSDEIGLDLIPFIYKQVAKWSKAVATYSRIVKLIIKENYKLDKVNIWDKSLPLFSEDKKKYSPQETKEIILKALSILGEGYVRELEEAFGNQSIDWFPRKDKCSGAYCIGEAYGIDQKFILMNFNEKYEDISTLAHELGHAIHAKEVCKKQDIYAGMPIFVAEIPSMLNEVLLNYYFLDQNISDKRKLAIYDHLISEFIASTSSQIVYSEWEYEVNKMILKGESLDASYGEKLYIEKLKKYHGSKYKKINALLRKSMSKILTVPHFYAGNFYVYKYSIGMVVAIVVARNIRDVSTREKAIENLYAFFHSGDSRSNLENIELLGYRLDDERLWESAKEIFEGWVKEYERLYREIYGE